jgi:hypothetical protein
MNCSSYQNDLQTTKSTATVYGSSAATQEYKSHALWPEVLPDEHNLACATGKFIA